MRDQFRLMDGYTRSDLAQVATMLAAYTAGAVAIYSDALDADGEMVLDAVIRSIVERDGEGGE